MQDKNKSLNEEIEFKEISKEEENRENEISQGQAYCQKESFKSRFIFWEH